MKKLTLVTCVLLACAFPATAQSLYWDSNDAAPGAGATPTGTWDAATAFWSTSPDGDVTAVPWSADSTAVFSAGDDAVNAFTVTVSGTQSAQGIVVEEGTPTFNGGSISLTGGATIEVADGSTAILGSTVITGSAGLTKEGAGTLQMGTTVNTYTGGATIRGGVFRTTANVATSFGNVANTLTMDGGELNTALTRNTFNPLVILQDAVFSKDVSGSLRTHTFTNSLTTSPGVTVTLRNEGSATFNLRFTGGAVSDANWVVGHPGDALCQLQFMGNTNWPDQVISGTISGPGRVRRTSTLDGIGASTILTGDNTYSGGTDNNGGMIGFGISSTGNPVTSGPIGTGSLTLLSDPVIGIFAHGGARTIGNDLIFGNVTYDLQIPGEHDLTMTGPVNLGSTSRSIIVDSTGITTFSGPISGTAAITKAGPGTLVWSGDNSNSGAITVNAGNLLVNNVSGSGTGSGAVTVNSGGTLGGTGTVAGMTTCTGTISPGADSVGGLTFQNGLNLSGGGTLLWELGAHGVAKADADSIILTGGNIVLGGSSKLAISFTGSASSPDSGDLFWESPRSWTIVNLTDGAGNPDSSNFTTIEGVEDITAGIFFTFVQPNGRVVLNYTPGSVVPEPTILSVTGASTANVTVTWTSVAGATYYLQYTDDLNPPINWVESAPVTATGQTTFITDDTASGQAERFYRVRAE